MTAQPRLALLGAGVMGSYHARVIAQSQRCTLARVVDPDAEAGQRLAERYATHWVPDVERLDDVDGVVVAAPTEAHPELVMRALASAIPVLVEKPVSDDLAQTELLVETADRNRVPLMCGFVERFNPAILTVLPLITEPVHIAAVRHSPYTGRIRTGVAWDLLIHDVDGCLRFVHEEPVEVRSGLGFFHPSSDRDGEDIAEVVMTFGTGAVASVSASRVGQRKVRSLNIAELNRTIEIDLLRRDVTIYRHVAQDSPSQDGLGYRQQTIIEIPELVSAREPLAAQLDRFLDLIDGIVEMKEERESILPAHRVVARVMASR
jgi:predicted dehydrogenase